MHTTQLRRAADPAKDLVKQWITQWSDAPGVVGNDSHTQIQGAPPCGCCMVDTANTQRPYASWASFTDAMDSVRGCQRMWGSRCLTAWASLRQRCLTRTSARCSGACLALDSS